MTFSVHPAASLKCRYSFPELLWTLLCYVNTRFFFRNSRLIRLPILIRNFGHIDLGVSLTTGYFCRLEVFCSSGKISFGSNVQIGDFCHITALSSIYIGANTLIAGKVFITDHDHGRYVKKSQASHASLATDYHPPSLRDCYARPVSIGANVWIGEGVSILAGVTIGDGCVIGAGSVVTKDLPPYTVCVGVPSRPLYEYVHNANHSC